MDPEEYDVQSGQVNFQLWLIDWLIDWLVFNIQWAIFQLYSGRSNYVMKMIHRKFHCSVILICRMMILIMMMLSKQSLLCANQNKIKNQLKDSHSFMTTIKYKKMKVNHGGEVWHVLNICVFLIAIKLYKPN